MKLHETLVQHLLRVYETNSGWTEEKKLAAALRKLDLTVYTQVDGNKILVETEHFRDAVLNERLKKSRGE